MPPFLLEREIMETSQSITPEIKKALDKAKIGLMSRPDSTFFTTVCFSLKHVWGNCNTAATDGRHIWINPEFFMSLKEEERIFLLIHESMHVAYLHMERTGSKDKQKWNIACDHYINLSLIARGFVMPASGFADPQYKGLNPDQIYPLLPEDPSDDFDPDLMDPIGDPAELQEHVKEILVRAATQAKMNGDSPGSIPGDIQIFLDNLLSPKLPWKVILSRFIQNMAKNDYSFKKLNRRFFPAHYLPGLYSEKLTEIAIAVDASGSVSDDDFKQMVSETHTILKQLNPDKITLVQFDAAIKSVNTVRSIRELMEVKFHGRGGTKIEPVIEWAKENKPKLLLVFSDGDFYFRVQENKIQTLWLIHDNPDFTAPFGKVIHYEM